MKAVSSGRVRTLIRAALYLHCGLGAAQSSLKTTPSVTAHAWAVEATHNELSLIEFEGLYLRYRVHILGPKGDQVRDVIESKDGTVARLILKDNHPLSSEEDAAERERLQSMLNSPAAFAKHIRSDQSGKKLAADLIRLMPDAMLFEYAPGQPKRGDAGGHPEESNDVVLDFLPNPAWHPPTLTSEALTGLRGRVWIDTRTHHVTRLEAEIFRGVSVGWGVIAHINPGGRFTLGQVEATPGRWIFSHFLEDITLRALMIKNISENRQIDSSGFIQVGAMSYQEAIKALLATPSAR